MASVTDDTTRRSASTGRGVLLAVVSAVAFGLSGVLASPMLDAGWSAGALVLCRVGIAALVVLPVAVVVLRGRWGLLRRNLGVVLAYGVLAVAGTQFCYFMALTFMQVGPALLIEYTAPAAVVAWWWLRHGERPSLVTVAGTAVAAVGLVLVLDLASGSEVSLPGVLWALGAMVGCAVYFLISADDSTGLPPLALAGGGLVVAAAALGLLGLVGLLPLRGASSSVRYAGLDVAWWVPLLLLGLVTAAIAYVSGIAAGRRLGSRLASFVALSEVVAGVVWAWALLGQLPHPVQLVGGALILLGVTVVRLGERSTALSARLVA